MLEIETVHHVSLPVSDLDRARAFYGGTLGLEETDRPPFKFGGAWYRVGDRSLHLIVPEPGEEPTFRKEQAIDSHDPKPSIANPQPMRLNPAGPVGFPQIYILDPDRNVIEINAARVD